MNRPTPTAIGAIALAALALTGCSSSGTKAASTPSAAVPAATFPVTEDSTTVTAKPTHIVSLSATATDMLFTIGAGSQVVAVDTNSDFFKGCSTLKLACTDPTTTPPNKLDSYKPNVEAIAADNPDLVVISDDQNKIQEQLVALKIPVYVAPAATSINDTYLQMTALGALTGNVSGAAAAVAAEKAAISSTLASLKPRTKPLSYYYELDQTYYSVTSKTFIGSLFTMANMINIADPADSSGKAGGYPQLSAEVIIKANPDTIFLADTVCCQQSATTVAARPGWSTLTAVKQNQIVPLNDDVASEWGSQVPSLLTQIVTASNAIPAS